jgi:hypothetical protein
MSNRLSSEAHVALHGLVDTFVNNDQYVRLLATRRPGGTIHALIENEDGAGCAPDTLGKRSARALRRAADDYEDATDEAVRNTAPFLLKTLAELAGAGVCAEHHQCDIDALYDLAEQISDELFSLSLDTDAAWVPWPVPDVDVDNDSPVRTLDDVEECLGVTLHNAMAVVNASGNDDESEDAKPASVESALLSIESMVDAIREKLGT